MRNRTALICVCVCVGSLSDVTLCSADSGCAAYGHAAARTPKCAEAAGCISTESNHGGCGDPNCRECGEGGCSACEKKLPSLKEIFAPYTSGNIGGWKWSAGAGMRYRYMDEQNRLRPAGTTRSTYDLWRFTPHLSVSNDTFTGYVQAIDGSIFNNEIAPVAIDENRSDLLRYYGDMKLDAIGLEGTRVRAGRQFLQYGSQHLVSPLAWANTFRNFEGVRLYQDSDAWAIDGFATRPVNGAAGNIFRPRSFDTPDQSAWFSGIYSTWKQAPGGTMDFYWLWLDEDNPRLNRHDGRRHTIGTRYAGTVPTKEGGKTVRTILWDAEGAWQFGEDSFQSGGAGQDVSAGFVSIIGGITFDSLPWSPTLKGVFWWGSGDGDPADGDINTLTTLFPLGHAYWGIIDNFNGANLLDYSVQLSAKPADKLTLTVAWHRFDKADTNDFIYNIAGAPLGPLGTPRHIGDEIDCIANYAVCDSMSVQFGYSWFWYGDAVNTTALARDDAHQFYSMVTLGF